MPGAPTQLNIAGRPVPVVALEDFYVAEPARVNSFVTNFGDWTLPAPVAAALRTPVAHLEWLHDTGELVLIGGVPHRGSAEAEVPQGEAVADEIADVVPGTGGSPVTLLPGDAPGSVRELFNAEVVPAGTVVAVVGTVGSGPRAHELLWGWHRHHRDADGWAWLAERLEGAEH